MAVAYYTIDHTLINGDLSDFQVGIRIDAATGFLTGLGETDWQLLHVTVAGVECYAEVDTWDPAGGTAVLWTRISSVSASADTVIRVQTGALNTAFVGRTGDAAAQAVWNGFDSAWHFGQDPSLTAPQVLDSSSNAFDLTANGAMTAGDQVQADFGTGLAFDGVDDYLKRDSSLQFAGNFTIIIKFDCQALPAMFAYLLHQGDYSASGDEGVALYWDNFGYASVDYYDGGELYWASPELTLNTGDNILIASFDSSNLTCSFSINGQTETVDLDTAHNDISASPLHVAAIKTTVMDNFSDVVIDELFIINQAFAPAWIKAIHHVLDGSLLSYSATDPGGGAIEPETAAQGIGFGSTAGGYFANNGRVDAGIALGASIGRNIIIGRGAAAGIGLSSVAGANVELARGGSETLRFSNLAGAFNYSAWLRCNRHLAVYRYHARITGAADARTDRGLTGLKSIQYRMRSESASYLCLVIVYDTALLAAIAGRPNGELVVDMAAVVDGEESLREELVRAPFYSVRHDRGSRNGSITLVGYTGGINGGKRVVLEGVTSATMLADGRMRYRCARPDFYLRPGDTAVHEAGEIVVDSISSLVAPTSQYMEVSE